MTEDGWLNGTNPHTMLAGMPEALSPRQHRLFLCACCRRLWHWVENTEAARAVEVAELFADDFSTKEELAHAMNGARRTARTHFAKWQSTQDYRDYIVHMHANACFVAAHAHLGNDNFFAQTYAYEQCRSAVWGQNGWHTYSEQESARQAGMLREIVGNPFRAVTFNSAWRTETAVSLARQMYELREFSAAPILADALQDADCDNEELLAHLRDGTQTHLRGCWAIDLVLGKW